MTEIQNLTKKNTEEEIKSVLNPVIYRWFKEKFKNFSESQKSCLVPIHERKNILLSSPTGSGKTLSAFSSILSHLITLSEKGVLENKVYCVYVSPLKALSNDIEANLKKPLEELEKLAGKSFGIRIGLRTGDTTAYEKAKMSKNPPHILITTPETLAIVLTTKKFVEAFKKVEFCVVDEIHAMGNKRGVYLSLSLERLNEMSKSWPVKIGLSATIEPLEEVAKFLVGIDEKRSIKIAKVPLDKKLDIEVLTPVENLIEHPNPYTPMYQLIHDLVKEHKTTLIFTNTRSATERVVNYLKDKFPTDYTESNIAAHHSSLSKGLRNEIEENLRQGKLRVVVCSTSLELGIDIGYIDLVILLGSPKASSRALQRIGRAGHQLHETAKGRFIVLDLDDLVECSVIQKEMLERKIDKIHFPKNALDVLAQQIFGMAIYKVWKIEELLITIRKSYCYHNLLKKDFLSVISYLSGDYELEKQWIYGKIWYDPEEKTIGKRGKMARVIYMTNIGTIPEESFITVKLAPSGEKIGVIDEGFLTRMKKSDVFVLGGSKYQYAYTKGMNLYVRSAINRSPTIPSWFSEMLPLSFESALEISKLRGEIKKRFDNKKGKKTIIKFLRRYLYINEKIAEEIYKYFKKQYDFAEFPTLKNITIESYIDERTDKKYYLVNSMYGRRVNDALSRAIAYLIGTEQKRDLEMGISDRGFYLSGENMKIEKAFGKLNSKNIEQILKEAIEKTDILTRRFRHCATRSLMILRNYRGQRKSVRKQQMKSHFLISAVKKISGEFPILQEAKREVLEDLMDINNTKRVLDWIKKGEVKISLDYGKIPSPFALSLIIQGHTDLMRIEDKQDFLKRMYDVYNEEIKRKIPSLEIDEDLGELLRK
jgi:ATP-dependent helicase Lhr and Lhr-like helicase